ncbi:hypothetical protein [Sphingobium baderi]|uniref:hypothetical protein n=1 Tax=Sphingobium baderi TaxID=1332080 RepID=UPI002B40FF73|nr:hypothetical protein [Sphingobium baderi]WRD77197.1 hypothetical protein QQ987_03395 [Sphingobium baderi]
MNSLSKKDKQGLMLIAAVVAILGLIVAYNMRLASRPKPDAQSCIQPVSKKTVFVLDQSDTIPEQTSIEIVRRIREAIAKDVQENELVTIFQVTDASRTSLRPIFTKCKPKQDGNELTENKRFIQKAFQEEFMHPLEDALSHAPPKSSSSPIGEILIDLSLTGFLSGEENRLYVFSDLMQNSSNASLYACRNADQAISEFRSKRAGAVERPSFHNAAISLNFIPREGIPRSALDCRNGFWNWFFGDTDGPNASVTPNYLPGGVAMQ